METPVQSPRVVDDLHSRNASDRSCGDSRIFNSDGDMSTREELVKDVWFARVDAYYKPEAYESWGAVGRADAAMIAYDEENT